MSSDARIVAFESGATNFDPADTNGTTDVYVRYLDTGQTVWASYLPGGTAGQFGGTMEGFAGNGRYVVYSTLDPHVAGDTGFVDVYVRDLLTMTAIRASVTPSGGPPNGESYPATISANGRCVAFVSRATNFLANDINGGSFNTGRDVFVRDLIAGTTELVSASSTGVQANSSCHWRPAISDDGRFVVFSDTASNLVPNDTNSQTDVFLRDRTLSTTVRVSVDSFGNETSGQCGTRLAVSSDGRYVVFNSDATNLVPGDTNSSMDVFVRDTWMSTTTRVSVGPNGAQGNGWSDQCAISGDGRRITYITDSTNLLPFDDPFLNDVALHDQLNGNLSRLSISTTGVPANQNSESPAISGSGSFVVYSSAAWNIVPTPFINTWRDVFLIGVGATEGTVYCTSTTNSQGCVPAISAGGIAPSASAGSGFVVGATQIVPNVTGALIYSVAGPQNTAVSGGRLCILARRPIPSGSSGGSTPCSGAFSIDFNSWIASGIDPALFVGTTVWSQYYSRDHGTASSLNLTDAIFFVIAP